MIFCAIQLKLTRPVSIPLMLPPSRPPAVAATADSGSPPAGRPVEAPPPLTRHHPTLPFAHTGWRAEGKANLTAQWDQWAQGGDRSWSTGCGRVERLGTSARMAPGGTGEWGSSLVWMAAGHKLLLRELRQSGERERCGVSFPLGVWALPALQPQVLHCGPLWKTKTQINWVIL